MAWPVEFDRSNVLGAIEEASGVSLSADDSLADTLIAKAQELGLHPVDLKIWIYDSASILRGWNPESLEEWSRRLGLGSSPAPAEALPRCAHCGAEVSGDPKEHKCDETGSVIQAAPEPEGENHGADR